MTTPTTGLYTITAEDTSGRTLELSTDGLLGPDGQGIVTLRRDQEETQALLADPGPVGWQDNDGVMVMEPVAVWLVTGPDGATHRLEPGADLPEPEEAVPGDLLGATSDDMEGLHSALRILPGSQLVERPVMAVTSMRELRAWLGEYRRVAQQLVTAGQEDARALAGLRGDLTAVGRVLRETGIIGAVAAEVEKVLPTPTYTTVYSTGDGLA